MEYDNLYARWQNIAITQGYPLIIGKDKVVFPTEYDDYFTVNELDQLREMILQTNAKPKLKDFESIKEDFIDELKQWDRADFRKTFVVAKTSEAMSTIGIANKEITLDAVKLNRIFKYHPAMAETVIMQLPDIVNDPVFILSSKSKESRIVATGEVFDKENNPVVVIMELNPKGKHGVELDEIKIASAYGKKNIQNLISTSEMLYLTENKEKINRWIKCTGLQLPFDLSSIDSSIIISNDDGKSIEIENIKIRNILEGEKSMGKDNPISIWVGNLASYNAGILEGEWLDLPMKDKELDEALAKISHDGHDEIMIFDTSSRDDCRSICNEIGEYENIHEVNLVAKLIGNETHPAVEMYIDYAGSLSMSEIANLIYKEEEIPYFKYDFQGSENNNLFYLMSDETKLGYTMIEQNSKIKSLLEDTEINGTSLYSYINVENIGRDAVLSGWVDVSEHGYLLRDVDGPDLTQYSPQVINKEINNQHSIIDKTRQQELDKKVKSIQEPTPVAPKL